jgi:hypothetical protein
LAGPLFNFPLLLGFASHKYCNYTRISFPTRYLPPTDSALLSTCAPKPVTPFPQTAPRHPTTPMDTFTEFTDIFAAEEFARELGMEVTVSDLPCRESIESQPLADSERYGSGTTSAFCVIA